MQEPLAHLPPPREPSGARGRMTWYFAAGGLLIVLLALLLQRKDPGADARSTLEPKPAAASVEDRRAPAIDGLLARRSGPRSVGEPAREASEVVSNKVAQFAQSRRKLARAMAEHYKVAVPDEFERFFEAAETGRYDEMKAIYDVLSERRKSGADKAYYGPHWRTIVETQGVADLAHDWPAQKLLDYGEAVLGALRPGMVYVGGTDPGCFIPTLLSETTDGERHIVLTQNALADGTYLDYLRFLYQDELATLTQDDSQRGFQEYMADAQKRWQHDQQFPTEPRQVRPGEDIRVVDNKVQVSGQVAVMTINETLLRTLMEKNPGLSFAMEESFPFKSTYASAVPLGPILELGVQDPQNALTPERAAQSVAYWQATQQQLHTDPDAAASPGILTAYARMAVAQAHVFVDRQLKSEAEQTFRAAAEICPSSPEAVFGYVNLLVSQTRIQDAIPVVENAVKARPDNRQFHDLLGELQKMATR